MFLACSYLRITIDLMRHPPSRGACTWAILGAKVTTSKSIVFTAKVRPAGRTLFVREFWRTHFFESDTPSWFIVFLWVFCTYTREWRWRRPWRRYHFLRKFEDHRCDIQNCILVQNSSKMFWRFKQYVGQIHNEFRNICDRKIRDICSLRSIYVRKFAAWCRMGII